MKNIIRKIIFKNMNQDSLDAFYRIYYQVRYPKEMQKKCSFGSLNEDQTFYVIRPRTDGTEGLMSLFINVAKNLFYASECGYEAIIDFQNYHTQYDDVIEGESNSWNFYFTQPTRKSLEEVYKSRRVILSGLEIQWYRPDIFERNYDDDKLLRAHDFIFEKIGFSDAVLEAVNTEIEKMNINFDNTLGLYLRGTDYISLQPSGHPIQPTIEQAVEVVKRYEEQFQIEKIFLVTEDGNIFKMIKELYGDKCIVVSYDSFVINYDGKKYLSHDKCIQELDSSPYMRGLNYLTKLIILSRCSFFVGGDTMGAWASCIFSKGKFKSKYIFNLGCYGK